MSIAEPLASNVGLAPFRPKVRSARYDPYENPPSDALFEVVNGERVEKPMGVFEQYIASRLHGQLEPYCRENKLGHAVSETKFAIPGSNNDRQPDVAFVSFQRWASDRGIPRVNAWAVVPELAVEVVSPSDSLFNVFDKMHEYFNGGVVQVWLVLSNVEQVHRFTSPSSSTILTRADDLTGDVLIPGFRMAVADLFPLAEPTS